MLPFILHVVAGLGAALVIVRVAILTLPFLVSWFVDRAAMVRGNKSKIAMTVADDIKNGKFNYIQGIFDTDKEQFTEARRIFADTVDDEVKRAHAASRVTIWS